MVNFCDIWFSNIEISNKNKLELLKKFKSTENIWNSTKNNLEKLKLDEKIISIILNKKNKINLDKYVRYMEKNEIQIITYCSEKYPKKLRYIKNSPAIIYLRGNLENLNNQGIAIVGARNATNYGKSIARKIAKELADRKINIISGLAIGIDKYAHLGALDSKFGRTTAVLGTGISDMEIYPAENKRVFERILEQNGTIISEFKLGTKPERYNFPLRNRIISGLAEKIIVVKKKKKSGSLITVDYALEQGKDVFAVPGNIMSEYSKGTNNLIAEGAYVFQDIKDLF